MRSPPNGLNFDTIIMDDPLADLPEHTSSPNGCTEDCPRCELEESVRSQQSTYPRDAGNDMADALHYSMTVRAPAALDHIDIRVSVDDLQVESEEQQLARERRENEPPDQAPVYPEGTIGNTIERLTRNNPLIQRAVQFGKTYGMSAARIAEQLRIPESQLPPAARMQQSNNFMIQNMANAFGINATEAAERLTRAIEQGIPRNSPMVLDIETNNLSPIIAGRTTAPIQPPLHHNTRSQSYEGRFNVGDRVIARDIYQDGVQHSRIVYSIGERSLDHAMGGAASMSGHLCYDPGGNALIEVDGIYMPVMRVDPIGIGIGDEVSVQPPWSQQEAIVEVISVELGFVTAGAPSRMQEGHLVVTEQRQLYISHNGVYVEIRDSERQPQVNIMDFVGSDFSQRAADMIIPNYGELEARITAQMARRIAQELQPRIMNPDGTPLINPQEVQRMAAEPAQIKMPSIMQIPVTQLEDLRTKRDGVEFKPTSTLECQVENRTGRYNMEMTLDFYIDREAMHDPAKMAETVGDLAHKFILNLMRQEGIMPRQQAAPAPPELGVRKITKDEEPTNDNA